MKKLCLFLLLYNSVNYSESVNSLISTALSQIIRDGFSANAEVSEIVVLGSNAGKLNIIVNEVANLISDFSSYKVSNKTAARGSIRIKHSTIFLFDSLKSYHDFFKQVLPVDKYGHSFRFLVYVLDVSEVHSKKLVLLTGMLYYTIFLVHSERDRSMSLMSLYFFQPPACGINMNKINQFVKATGKWANKVTFPSKFENFNGCKLTIEISVPQEPAFECTITKYNTCDFSGYGIEIVKIISKALNFSVHFKPLNHFQSDRPFNDTSNIHSTLRVLPMRMLKVFGSKVFTSSFTSLNEVLLISKSKQYTPYEKLFLPFETEVWTWLIITFAVAVLAIVILRLVPSKFRSFVIGSKVTTPSMNLL